MCLSDVYVNVNSLLHWRCAQGHEWFSTGRSVRNMRSWCPRCYGNAALSIKVATDLAANKGGKCLSRTYYNSATPMAWQCKVGHTWKATLNNVRNAGSWCPVCARSRSKSTVASAKKLAIQNGGCCLSSGCEDARTRLKWKCSKGHIWEATTQSIRSGRWCPICARIKTSSIHMSVAHQIARSRGGCCLSKVYINNKSKLDWQCSKGHRWEACLHHVKNSKTWCPRCPATGQEEDVRAIFETVFRPRHFPRCRPGFLAVATGRNLELDGYCQEIGVAFEFNGGQHYESGHYWNSFAENLFEQQLQRDAAKIVQCRAHGVRLVVVPCMVKDRWTFVRSWLLKWFSVDEIFPVAIPEFRKPG